MRKGRILHLFREQAGECVYCHDTMILEIGEKRTATIDHVIPRSKGGPNTQDNVVAACSECNEKKGRKLPLNFIAEMN